jgi:uncharacterized tellurite resistance protein B-like protein
MAERTLILALAQLLAAAAWADGTLSPDEINRMKQLLRQLRRADVKYEAESVDYVRLTTAFLGATSEEQRISFLDALFAVAAADGRISTAEIDEIRRIAHSLKITTRDVNAARDRATRHAAPPDGR